MNKQHEIEVVEHHNLFFGDVPARIIKDEHGEPWWVARDVCDILGIGNISDAMGRLDDDERGSIQLNTPGGVQKVWGVNESGLYSLVNTSRKPQAKAFKRWVNHEVLPAIRRTGTYTHPAAE